MAQRRTIDRNNVHAALRARESAMASCATKQIELKICCANVPLFANSALDLLAMFSDLFLFFSAYDSRVQRSKASTGGVVADHFRCAGNCEISTRKLTAQKKYVRILRSGKGNHLKFGCHCIISLSRPSIHSIFFWRQWNVCQTVKKREVDKKWEFGERQ